MRKLVSTGIISLALLGFTTIGSAAELAEFTKIAKSTMAKVTSGSPGDIDELIKMQTRLVAIGKAACEEYAGKHPRSAKMLNLVAENANKMSSLTLEEIEAQWHEKGLLKSKGIRTTMLEEKSVTGSLMDTVVHPATAIIALRMYKKSKDKALLQQVNDELEEVVHHVEMIKM